MRVTFALLIVAGCAKAPAVVEAPSGTLCVTVRAADHAGLSGVCVPIDRADVAEKVIADAKAQAGK